MLIHESCFKRGWSLKRVMRQTPVQIKCFHGFGEPVNSKEWRRRMGLEKQAAWLLRLGVH
jgi:hypothetical protein